MPAVIFEKFDSREAQVAPGASTAELLYGVVGTEDDNEVHDLVDATVPSTFRGLVVQSYRIEHRGGGVWDVVARYGLRARRETGQSVVAYDTTGGTQHITQSISTAVMGKAAGVAGAVPDLKGAIGVHGDQVDGVDVTIAVLNLTETHFLPAGSVGAAFWVTVSELTGKVNAGPFRGFESGEVLFLGASGSQRGIEDWEITFRFAISRNAVGLVIAGSLPFDKKGWEYLWVRYADEVDTTANALVKRPKYLYVERVYDVDDFSLLGIGG